MNVEAQSSVRIGWGAWLFIVGGLSVVVVLVLAMLAPDAPVIRSLPLYRPFTVPSQSMHPTLREGEYFFADMNHYRVHEPDYGDLALFRHGDRGTVYVKRLVGKPGDRVQMINGVLNINGQPLKHESAGIDQLYENGALGDGAKLVKETLPNGASYVALDIALNSPGDNTEVFSVPDGAYFMLGDNLDNSNDSRNGAPFGVGFVHRDQFIGKAAMIYFSPALSRIGARLR